ncbi:MAG: DUF4340 domain-containing protein [Treponema sp.]|nr:DUF4340 domain-containing protein [Treponema sp.]
MKRKLIIIWSLVAFFTLTYLLSFIKTSSKDNRKAIKTSLLNPKNTENLSQFEFSDLDSTCSLIYNENLNKWEIKKENQVIYADSKKIDSLIAELSKISEVYKISNNSKDKNFGFEGGDSAFSLTYYLKDGKSTQINFGNHDFSDSYRYFKNSDNPQVYEISSTIDNFLTTSIQYLSDPLIISKEILGKRNYRDVVKYTYSKGQSKINSASLDKEEFNEYISKIFDLRHSGFADSPLKDLDSQLIIDFGDKSSLILSIYPSEIEGQYSLQVDYFDYLINKNFSSQMKISTWTYNKINVSKL